MTLLGQTGLEVSRMGLGLAALGRPGYITLGHAQDLNSIDSTHMQAQTLEVLDAAYRLGIRYFDAARSYGQAEAFLSSWLQSRLLPDVVIGSKWGYVYTADWQVQAEKHEIKEHSKANLERQLAESLHHLPGLNLYQIHSATLESGVLDNQDVLDKLAEIKDVGIRIGLSLSGPAQAQTLEKALRIVRKGQRLFDTVQATYNLLETSASETLELAHREGMGVIIKEALANGRLTARNTSMDVTQFAKMNHYAEHYGVPLDAFALAFVLQQPWAHVVLSGAATAAQLTSNLKALEVAPILDIEDVSESPEDYWQKRAKLQWN